MSNQLDITGGARVRGLNGVITGTTGVLNSLPINSPNGIPQLDVNGKILVSQLPNSVMEFLGTWNAATNTPTLADGTGNAGDVYLCTVAGTVNFGSGPIVFNDGDYVVYSGSTWERSGGAMGTVTSVAASITGNSVGITGSPITTAGTLAFAFAGTNLQYVNGAGNLTTFPTLITSIGLSMPTAFNVANSPLTANGTIAVTGAGTASQYIRGDGQLATFPTTGGGGSSVYYYLNGSIPASVVGYEQMSNVAVVGTGTDFNISGNGLIAQFLTDAGNPNRTLIPSGAWNFEMFFSSSSNGGNEKFYLELVKYNGSTFTTIASTSTNPEAITGGTTTDLYITSMAVPETTLLVTDRLAIRVYIVDNSGARTITLHTEDNNLCQIITTFSNGIASLNGLTESTQYLAVGTAGSDFNISSLVDTHTFNLPTASSTKRGALSSADWSTFSAKQNALTLTTTGTSGAATLIGATLNIPNYTPDLSGYVTIATTQTITGNKTFNEATKQDSGLLLKNGVSTSAVSYTSLSGSISNGLVVQLSGSSNQQTLTFQSSTANSYTFPAASGTIALTSNLSAYVPTSRTLTINGTTYDLSADRTWTISTGISGTGTTNYLPKFTGASTIGNSAITDDGTTVTLVSRALSGTSATFSDRVFSSKVINSATISNSSADASFLLYAPTTTNYYGGIIGWAEGNIAASISSYDDGSGGALGLSFATGNNASISERLKISSTGAATFSSSITAGGDITTTNTQNGTSSIRLNNSSSGSSANARLLLVSDSGNAQIKAVSSTNVTYGVGDAMVLNADTMSGGMLFAHNDSVKMSLTAAGYLGVATTTPFSALTLGQITGIGAELTYEANSNASSRRWKLAPDRQVFGDFAIQQSTTQFGTTWASILYLSAAGNVGINTTTDSGYKLDVNGTGRFSGAVKITTGTDGLDIGAQTGNSYRANAIFRGTTSGGSGVNGYTGVNVFSSDGSMDIAVSGSNALKFYPAGSLALTLASTGAATFSNTVTATGQIIANAGSGAISVSGTGYTINPTNMLIGRYTSTRGYIQVPTNGTFEIWNGGTSEIATFNETGRTTTLYGALSGTSATFSSSVTAGGINTYGSGGLNSTSYQLNASISSSASASSVAPVARFSNNGGGYVTKIMFSDNNRGDAYITHVAGSAFTPSTRWLGFGVDAVDQMIINASGNVGIGTSSPDSYPYGGKLNVNGSISSSGGKIGFGVTDSFSAFGESIAHYGMTYNSSSNPTCISGYFGVSFFSEGSERMRITSGANVLIGTTTDNGVNKLQVNGSIYASGDITSGGTITFANNVVNYGGNTTYKGATGSGDVTLSNNGSALLVTGPLQKNYGSSIKFVGNGSTSYDVDFSNAGYTTKTVKVLGSVHLETTNSSFVVPRMTTAERDALNANNKIAGAIIYNTSVGHFQGYNGSGWTNFW